MSSDDTVDHVPPSIPPLAGRWQIGERLGGGGEGVVFAAEPVEGASDTEGRALVVKLTWSRTGASELKTLLKLQHRHLATYRDFGTLPAELWRGLGLARPPDSGETLLWIIMSRADGSLAQMIGERSGSASRPLEAAAAIRLWHHLTDALAYLKEQRTVHGDIKPANVLAFSTERGTDWRLADFGMSTEIASGFIRGTVQGLTPTYASPEVVRTGRASFADDRYSAALTVHVAATGVLPFDSSGGLRIAPWLPPELVNPISEAIGGSGEGAPTGRQRRSKRWAALFGSLVLVLLLGAAAFGPGLAARGGKQQASGSTPSPLRTTTTSRRSIPTTSSAATSTSRATTTTDAPVIPVGPAAGTGSTLYFVRTHTGRSALYRLDVATGTTTKVDTGTTDVREMSVSASGRYVGTTETGSGSSLVVGEIGKTNSTVYDVPGNASEPAISADGNRVAFASDKTGDLDIMVLDLETKQVVTAAGNPWDERSPVWTNDDPVEFHGLYYISSGSPDPGNTRSDGIGFATVPALMPGEVSDSGTLYNLAEINDDILGASSLVIQPASEITQNNDFIFVAKTAGGADPAFLTWGGEGTLKPTAQTETDVAWCPEGLVTAATGRGLTLFPANGKKPQRLTSDSGDSSLSCVVGTGDAQGTDGISGSSATTTPP